MPQTQHESEQDELHDVVAPVDQPEDRTAIGELIVDAEGGGDPAGADDEAALDAGPEFRARAEDVGEGRRGDEREDEADREDAGRMDVLLRRRSDA